MPQDRTPDENAKKQQLLYRLVSNYDPDTHRRQFLPCEHPRHRWYHSFEYLTSPLWDPAVNGRQPYVVATMLLDAYGQLPARPDLAFSLTWSATNSAYNDLYLHDAQSPGAVLTDSKSIEHAASRIAGLLHHEIHPGAREDATSSGVTVEQLLRRLMQAIPRKTLHFLASYILKGHCIHTATQHAPGNGGLPLRSIHVPPSYSSFKKHYPELFKEIEESFARKYLALCHPKETADKVDVTMGIAAEDAEKSRRLVDALGQRLRNAWAHHTIANGGLFPRDLHWVRFPLQCILYASRNGTVHGNVPSRLNSFFSDADSVTSNAWLFLCCYVYLGLILKCSGSINLDDLAPLVRNVDRFAAATAATASAPPTGLTAS